MDIPALFYLSISVSKKEVVNLRLSVQFQNPTSFGICVGRSERRSQFRWCDYQLEITITCLGKSKASIYRLLLQRTSVSWTTHLPLHHNLSWRRHCRRRTRPSRTRGRTACHHEMKTLQQARHPSPTRRHWSAVFVSKSTFASALSPESCAR